MERQQPVAFDAAPLEGGAVDHIGIENVRCGEPICEEIDMLVIDDHEALEFASACGKRCGACACHHQIERLFHVREEGAKFACPPHQSNQLSRDPTSKAHPDDVKVLSLVLENLDGLAVVSSREVHGMSSALESAGEWQEVSRLRRVV